jgi:hypothetical protein
MSMLVKLARFTTLGVILAVSLVTTVYSVHMARVFSVQGQAHQANAVLVETTYALTDHHADGASDYGNIDKYTNVPTVDARNDIKKEELQLNHPHAYKLMMQHARTENHSKHFETGQRVSDLKNPTAIMVYYIVCAVVGIFTTSGIIVLMFQVFKPRTVV